MSSIRQKIHKFMWLSFLHKSKFHLDSLESLSLPKICGCWGIKRLDWFSKALHAKKIWRCLFEVGLLISTIKSRYLKGILVVKWIRQPKSIVSNSSIVWRGFMQVFPRLEKWLGWCVGNGIQFLRREVLYSPIWGRSCNVT